MTFMKFFVKLSGVLASVAMLSGCSTPQEDCISGATKDYRSLQASIAETSDNVSRGYAVHSQSVPYTYSGSCYDYNTQLYYTCPQTGYRTQESPVAIDVNQERKKLAEFNKLLPKYKDRADRAVAQCKVQYPE